MLWRRGDAQGFSLHGANVSGSQADGYKHYSFKGFNTQTEAVNFMITAGISVQEIDFVETEAIMKKSLISQAKYH